MADRESISMLYQREWDWQECVRALLMVVVANLYLPVIFVGSAPLPVWWGAEYDKDRNSIVYGRDLRTIQNNDFLCVSVWLAYRLYVRLIIVVCCASMVLAAMMIRSSLARKLLSAVQWFSLAMVLIYLSGAGSVI